MGHNGAGKTTLINVLGGLIAYNSGKLRMFDKIVDMEMEDFRKKLGIVS
jgi:ABC-type multidrug transport system ATPase subunit